MKKQLVAIPNNLASDVLQLEHFCFRLASKDAPDVAYKLAFGSMDEANMSALLLDQFVQDKVHLLVRFLRPEYTASEEDQKRLYVDAANDAMNAGKFKDAMDAMQRATQAAGTVIVDPSTSIYNTTDDELERLSDLPLRNQLKAHFNAIGWKNLRIKLPTHTGAVFMASKPLSEQWPEGAENKSAEAFEIYELCRAISFAYHGEPRLQASELNVENFTPG
jgi:hypothetical protein